MAKRKLIQFNLIRNSISAYFAAIELHNKPNILYRYETVSLLLINAWELLLKAFVKKYCKKRSIFRNEQKTISFKNALEYTEEYINKTNKNSFRATKENLIILEEYRDNVVHFYNEAIEPIIFTLIAKSALDFVGFVKRYFNKDIIMDEGLFILPLGFKLPFKPEDYLSKKSANYKYSEITKRFIYNIVSITTKLKKESIEDSVVLGFNMYLDSVKNITNSDLLVAITNKDEADLNIAQIKKVQFTNDPHAAKFKLSDEEIFERFPLTYKDIQLQCSNRYSDCVFNMHFHRTMNQVKKDPNITYGRILNPKREGKPDIYLYSEKIFDFLDKHYTKAKTQTG